jgi:nucleoside-diphosphate-sugar epimerase
MKKNTGDVVIVTGGVGFIGSALVQRLSRRLAVVVLDQSCPPELPAGTECVAVDLHRTPACKRRCSVCATRMVIASHR